MYFILLTIFSITGFFLSHTTLKEFFLVPILLFASIPVLRLFWTSRDKRVISLYILVIILMLLLFFLTFRMLRDSLPPPAISENKIIGYTQYFGYPYWLDTIIFFIFLIFPLITFILNRIKKWSANIHYYFLFSLYYHCQTW